MTQATLNAQAQAQGYHLTTTYRYHPVYILQPLDWLLLALAVILVVVLIMRMNSKPKNTKLRKMKSQGPIPGEPETFAEYTAIEEEPIVYEQSPVMRHLDSHYEEDTVPESHYTAVVNQYEDELEARHQDIADLEEGLCQQQAYTVAAFHEGAAQQAAIDQQQAQEIVEIAFQQGVSEGAAAAAEEFQVDLAAAAIEKEAVEAEIEKAFCAGLQAQIEMGVESLQQQLAELALEKEALALAKRQVQAADANVQVMKHEELNSEVKLALMDHERRLAALEAQRSNCYDITALQTEIDAQQRLYHSSQSLYASSLQEQHNAEQRQLQVNFLFLSEQQRAATTLIETQRMMEEEQAAALTVEQMDYIIAMREANERLQKSKNDVLSQLEAIDREIEEATPMLRLAMNRNANVHERILIQESAKQKRNSARLSLIHQTADQVHQLSQSLPKSILKSQNSQVKTSRGVQFQL